ncbi:MAG: radical SAM family heme chaperone HemW [Armatimonadetes bacterium]|nr:radical SAM family heme chaperone HemW [Armatimonadota bacterium]
MSDPIAVYLHVPFCPSKCGYCDFNSYAMDGEIVERTVAAMVKEVNQSPHRGRPAKTVFFGGGTPTFIAAEQSRRLLEAVLSAHPPIEGCEITSEANPGTVDIPKFNELRSMGFNRISLGAQSFDTSDLIRLGRVHEASHIGRAVDAARSAGFHNLNLDLMFGLPGQSAAAWQRNLDLAMRIEPEHLSLYCLTIEPNTRYYRLHVRGMLDLPDDDVQTEMYDTACEVCDSRGYHQYEISNFAKPGKECRHNLCYWRGEEYVGYGPGAVGCVGPSGDRTRYTNTKHPDRYCQAVDSREGLWCDSEHLDKTTLRLERIMLGIRLNEGLPKDAVALDVATIEHLERKGLVEPGLSFVRLTTKGRHYCSDVALELA